MKFKKLLNPFLISLMFLGVWAAAAPVAFVIYMEYFSKEAVLAAHVKHVTKSKVRIGMKRSEVIQLLNKADCMQLDWPPNEKVHEKGCLIVLPSTIRIDNPALVFDEHDRLYHTYPHFGD